MNLKFSREGKKKFSSRDPSRLLNFISPSRLNFRFIGTPWMRNQGALKKLDVRFDHWDRTNTISPSNAIKAYNSGEMMGRAPSNAQKLKHFHSSVPKTTGSNYLVINILLIKCDLYTGILTRIACYY